MSNSPTAYFQKLTFHLLLPQHPQKKFPYCYYFFTSPGSPDVDEGIAWLRVDFKSYRLKPEFFFFSFHLLLAENSHTRAHMHIHRFHSTVNMTRDTFLPSLQHLPSGISPALTPWAESVCAALVPAAALSICSIVIVHFLSCFPTRMGSVLVQRPKLLYLHGLGQQEAQVCVP